MFRGIYQEKPHLSDLGTTNYLRGIEPVSHWWEAEVLTPDPAKLIALVAYKQF